MWTVSLSDSPLSTAEPVDLMFTTSAERRLAASSKEELVRVEELDGMDEVAIDPEPVEAPQ